MLMVLVMVNKRRTLVLLSAWKCKGWVWCMLGLGYWATFWFSKESQALKRNKEFIKTGKEMALKWKEKMKCFNSIWIKNAIVYNTLLIVYFKVMGYWWMNYYREVVYYGCMSGNVSVMINFDSMVIVQL